MKPPLAHGEHQPRRPRPASAPSPKPLGREVNVGRIGEFLDLVAPQSEADPAAILAHVLVYVGNAVGPNPHFMVDGGQHGCKLNALIVGSTSQGRKGTSEAYPRRLMSYADPGWTKQCIVSGLSSGEGLVAHVRDPVETRLRDQQGNPITQPGAPDKRAAVLEPEFGRTLRTLRREGNTCGTIIRLAWDRGDLAVMTKEPIRATNAHISIIGHITKMELMQLIDGSDVFGGTLNRFGMFSVQRQRQLPFGGHVPEPELEQLGKRLGKHLEKARSRTAEFPFTDEARNCWPSHYRDLTALEEEPGLTGALLGRAIPQVRRMAMVFAIGDGADAVDEKHVLAALEVWRFCTESARHIFGQRTGNPLADRIEDGLREHPDNRMTRSELRQLLGGRTLGDHIDAALELLASCGRARRELDRTTGGRPTEVWHLIQTS